MVLPVSDAAVQCSLFRFCRRVFKSSISRTETKEAADTYAGRGRWVMQTFDVSLCFVKNVLNIRRGVRKDFFKFKVKFGECCGNGIIRMLERSLQGKKSTVNLVGMLVKILHSSLDLSSLFIPYLDCCPLKHRAYSSQGKSAKEAKQEQMGRETVCLEADKCVFSITCRWTVYVVHSDQILERQVLNLVFTCCFFVLDK